LENKEKLLDKFEQLKPRESLYDYLKSLDLEIRKDDISSSFLFRGRWNEEDGIIILSDGDGNIIEKGDRAYILVTIEEGDKAYALVTPETIALSSLLSSITEKPDHREIVDPNGFTFFVAEGRRLNVAGFITENRDYTLTLDKPD
jgi:hypothetical protein